jgi:hypothetical protein
MLQKRCVFKGRVDWAGHRNLKDLPYFHRILDLHLDHDFQV